MTTLLNPIVQEVEDQVNLFGFTDNLNTNGTYTIKIEAFLRVNNLKRSRYPIMIELEVVLPPPVNDNNGPVFLESIKEEYVILSSDKIFISLPVPVDLEGDEF